MKKSDIVLLYDNCSCHVSGFSAWWMKNIRCNKLTVVSYTPEFNPIERLFNTLKWISSTKQPGFSCFARAAFEPR